MIEVKATIYRPLECRPDSYQSWYQQGNRLRIDQLYSEALMCYEKALEWYNSDEYKQIIDLRLNNTEGNLIIIKGV